MGLAGLPKWLKPERGHWDVIHFNWGLWDLCYRHPESKNQGRRDKVRGIVTHNIEDYVANLDKLVTELEKTGATLVFATTTPVPEGEAGRKLGDDVKYNKAAVDLMQKRGVAVNDLHSLMAKQMALYQTKPGDVHFKPEGSKLLAKQVAAHVEKAFGEWTTVFDGTDLDAFELQDPGGWYIDDEGSATCRMTNLVRKGKTRRVGRGYMWSKEDYGDFVLDVEYKLSPASNSGVFYRTDFSDSVQAGLELQLMDNVGFQERTGKKDDRKLNGSFYDCQAPSVDAQKPIGEWNDLRIHCHGPRIRFRLNGTLVIDVNIDDWTEAGKNPDGSTNKFKRALKDFKRNGRIGFQNHGDPVWFRNVRIRPL